MFKKIAFIGTGNMGAAVAKAVSAGANYEELCLANRTAAKAEKLAALLKGARLVSNREAAGCDLIFLAVKPFMMPEVAEEIAPVLAARTDRFVLCTMAAALSCERIRELMGGSYPVIRIMPNTPAAVGAGTVQYCSLGVTEEELTAFRETVRLIGTVDPIEERLIDAASAVSGCGPAFAAMFAEALADGGVACGLPRAKAMLYAASMLAGTAKLMLESGEHPGALKDAVCSPGGSTIQGVRTLEEAGFRGAVTDAVIAAYEKTLEMR